MFSFSTELENPSALLNIAEKSIKYSVALLHTKEMSSLEIDQKGVQEPKQSRILFAFSNPYAFGWIFFVALVFCLYLFQSSLLLAG